MLELASVVVGEEASADSPNVACSRDEEGVVLTGLVEGDRLLGQGFSGQQVLSDAVRAVLGGLDEVVLQQDKLLGDLASIVHRLKYRQQPLDVHLGG